MVLDADEKELIRLSLNMRKNYIETGSVSVGSVDVSRLSPEERLKKRVEIKALTIEQMQILIKIQKLLDRL